MTFYLKLWLTYESNTHDGYCSDEDCKYETEDETVTIPMDTNSNLGKYLSDKYNLDDWCDHTDNEIINLVKQYDRSHTQAYRSFSHYCRNNEQAKSVGLKKHKFRVTAYLARLLSEIETE
jgi:hypothetical protein